MFLPLFFFIDAFHSPVLLHSKLLDLEATIYNDTNLEISIHENITFFRSIQLI